MERIFTFGMGQRDPRTGRALAERYVRVTADDIDQTRDKMLYRFGHVAPGGFGNWAFDYDSDDAAGVETYGLIEIDFTTGLDVSHKGMA